MKFKNIWEKSWIRSVKEGKTGLRTKILRLFGVILTKILIYTPITANQVSILGILAILAASVLFAFGDFWFSLIAVLVLYVGEVLDYTDGAIARCKNQTNLMLADFICKIYHPCMFAFIFVGIGIGVYFNTNNILFILLGFLAAIFQQTTIYILELKNTVILSYMGDKIKNTKDIRKTLVGSSKKKQLLTLFAFPIEGLYMIILIFIIINRLDWFLMFYVTYLFIRMLIFSVILFQRIKKMSRSISSQD